MEIDSRSASDEEKSGETTFRDSPSTEFAAVPSFLLKTYDIVNNLQYKDWVKWNEEGDAFIILNNDFWEKILPVYFRHKNMSSFIRQLNIYGFKKTKSKNEEQCFAHKDFRKDNKKLLLNMKRKTKNSDKKSQNGDSYIKKSEVLKLVKDMNERIVEQESRIENLIKSNKEFKNSVLALYTELEKSKEREKKVEKILIELAPLSKTQNNSGKILNEELSNQLKEKFASDNIFRLENSDLLNLFRSFVENFIQKLGNNDVNNLYFDNRNNFNYYQRANQSPGTRQIFPFEMQKFNHNNMLENGPLKRKYSSKNSKHDLFEYPLRKREAKALRSNSVNESDIWEKLSDGKISGFNQSSHHDFMENIDNGQNIKTPYMYSWDQSLMSEIGNKEKIPDNVSVSSKQSWNNCLLKTCIGQKQMSPFLGNFELISHQSKGDLSDINSVSSFSSENKFWGMKRRVAN